MSHTCALPSMTGASILLEGSRAAPQLFCSTSEQKECKTNVGSIKTAKITSPGWNGYSKFSVDLFIYLFYIFLCTDIIVVKIDGKLQYF